MKSINKTMLKKLKKMSDKDLKSLAYQYKVMVRSDNTQTTARDYNTVLYEAKKRGLMK